MNLIPLFTSSLDRLPYRGVGKTAKATQSRHRFSRFLIDPEKEHSARPAYLPNAGNAASSRETLLGITCKIKILDI